MALFNRKHPETVYTARAESIVVVHVMGASFVFENRNVLIFFDPVIKPKVAGVKKFLNFKTKDESLASLTFSTEDGVKLDLTSTNPNGSDYTLSATRESYGGFELTSCSAELNYGCLELSYYKDGTTTIRVDETDDSYVLPVKSKRRNKTSYEFYVVKRYADTTLEDVIKGRSNRIRIPGAKHIILDKVGSCKDWYGCTVLQMDLIVKGIHTGNVFVRADAPGKKVVPEILYQVVPGTPIPLS